MFGKGAPFKVPFTWMVPLVGAGANPVPRTVRIAGLAGPTNKSCTWPSRGPVFEGSNKTLKVHLVPGGSVLMHGFTTAKLLSPTILRTCRGAVPVLMKFTNCEVLLVNNV